MFQTKFIEIKFGEFELFPFVANCYLKTSNFLEIKDNFGKINGSTLLK